MLLDEFQHHAGVRASEHLSFNLASRYLFVRSSNVGEDAQALFVRQEDLDITIVFDPKCETHFARNRADVNGSRPAKVNIDERNRLLKSWFFFRIESLFPRWRYRSIRVPYI